MLKYVKRYWYFALLAPLFMIGEVISDLLQPQFMSKIIDDGVLGLNNKGIGDLDIVINTGLVMILIVFIGALCGVLSGVFSQLCGQKFAHDLRRDCFKRIMNLSLEQTYEFSTGSLITRITNDITQIQNLLSMMIRGFVRTMALFIGGIFCMLALDISFGLILGCALPFVIIFIFYFLKKAKPEYKKLQERLDNLNSIMQEDVSGARVIKAFVKEDDEINKFDKANKKLSKVQLFVLKLFSYMNPISNLILNFTIIAVIYVGSINIKNNIGIYIICILFILTPIIKVNIVAATNIHITIYS